MKLLHYQILEIHLLEKWCFGLSRQAPLDHCVVGHGVGPTYSSIAGLLLGCWGHWCVFPPTEHCSRPPQPFHSRPRVVPWSHPCIKTSWVWVRRGEHSCSHIICSWLLLLQPIDHCVNKHDTNGKKLHRFTQKYLVSALHSAAFNCWSEVFWTCISLVISCVLAQFAVSNADCPFHSWRAAHRTVFQLGWDPV